MPHTRFSFTSVLFMLSLLLACGCARLTPVVHRRMMVETKIVRVSAATLTKLGIDPVSDKSDWTRLATSPDVETLAGGSVMVASEQDAMLKAVQSACVPLDYEILPVNNLVYASLPTPVVVPPAAGKTNEKKGNDEEEENTVKIEDMRPPLPASGRAILPVNGEPYDLGYALHVTPTIGDDGMIFLALKPSYAWLDGFTAAKSVPAQKVPHCFEWCKQADMKLRDGVTGCFDRKRVAGSDNNDAWQFILVTAKLADVVADIGEVKLDSVTAPAPQVVPPSAGFKPEEQQVEVVYEAVEIPRKALLELAAKNGFKSEDVLANAGMLPAALVDRVRSSPQALRIGFLSGIGMSGNECCMEDVHQEYFPFSWDPFGVSRPLPERYAGGPESPEYPPQLFGSPTSLGTTLRFEPQVRAHSIIHVKLDLEKTALESWGEPTGWMEINGQTRKCLNIRAPLLACLEINTEIDLLDGATVQLARLQGQRVDASAGTAFFGADNILKPGAKLSGERDLFLFITAQIVRPDGMPARK